MNGQLADETEACGVAHGGIKTPELGSSVLHQVDALDVVNCCVSCALDEALVDLLQDCFAKAGVRDDHQAS